MKTRTLLAATLAATLALAGCSKNDEPDEPTRAAVNIRTSIGGTTDAGSFGSRAAIGADGSGNFEAGDVLGLYATAGTTAKLANSAYTVGSTALWWDELSMTDPVAFAAYYPKAEAITDPAATIFNAATATNKDLLLATPVTASKGEDVALAFRHAMHRLTVNLSTDIDGWNLATAQVSLAGMNASATVNITAGTVTPGEADATDGDYGTKTGASTTFVVAPQKVTADADWIQITMDGKQYVYNGNPPITEGHMQMGVKDVTLSEIVPHLETGYSLYGENFTKSSKVYVNGEKQKSTFLNNTRIELPDTSDLQYGDIITVSQVGSSNTVFRTSNEYVYQNGQLIEKPDTGSGIEGKSWLETTKEQGD